MLRLVEMVTHGRGVRDPIVNWCSLIGGLGIVGACLIARAGASQSGADAIGAARAKLAAARDQHESSWQELERAYTEREQEHRHWAQDAGASLQRDLVTRLAALATKLDQLPPAGTTVTDRRARAQLAAELKAPLQGVLTGIGLSPTMAAAGEQALIDELV